MNLIDRVKNIITNPKREWDVISIEPADSGKMITGYVLPLAGIAAIAAFIGYGFIGFNVLGFRISGIDWGIYQALTVLIGVIASVFITALVVDALAPSFGSEKKLQPLGSISCLFFHTCLGRRHPCYFPSYRFSGSLVRTIWFISSLSWDSKT